VLRGSKKKMKNFVETGCFILIYATMVLLAIGQLYWFWMAVKFGSFGMFLVGVFPLSWIVTAPVGAYSFLFKIPDWVVRFFG
jgi:hypothetical protein